jgi:hypothetical protein
VTCSIGRMAVVPTVVARTQPIDTHTEATLIGTGTPAILIGMTTPGIPGMAIIDGSPKHHHDIL